MNKLRLGTILFLSIIGISSCEKDDICVDADTPLLVLEFFDIADTSALKEVPNLRVIGLGQSANLNAVANLNTISIPLKTTEDATSLLMVSNSALDENGNETGNIDTLTFSYNRLENFASRGCGFIVNYENLTDQLASGADNWIQDVEIVRSLIINTDSTHVKIFH
ncbi:MAG: DUF6452 family protein [Maribacter sp.]